MTSARGTDPCFGAASAVASGDAGTTAVGRPVADCHLIVVCHGHSGSACQEDIVHGDHHMCRVAAKGQTSDPPRPGESSNIVMAVG